MFIERLFTMGSGGVDHERPPVQGIDLSEDPPAGELVRGARFEIGQAVRAPNLVDGASDRLESGWHIVSVEESAKVEDGRMYRLIRSGSGSTSKLQSVSESELLKWNP